jgi:antitoxin component YwqK of YwqJK toxin-antitoxin module
MKLSGPSWRWIVPFLATIAFYAADAAGQFTTGALGGVKVAEPVAVPPEPQKVPHSTDSTKSVADKGLSASEDKTETQEPAPVEPEPAAEEDLVVELVRERFPGGAIKIEREVTQDAAGNYRLHGMWRHYDVQGRLILDGRFANNQKEGTWRRYYRGDETPLLATVPYKEFTAPFLSVATFHAGAMHGKWTITDAKQRMVHELEFCDGERHGKATWYYPNGAIMLQTRYEHGRINGDVIEFAPDATVIAKEIYQGGRMLAPKTEFYDDAQQSKKQEVSYLHAILVVKDLDNWDAGLLATFESRGQDERHGPYAIWHPTGQLAKQGEFRYNLPVGKITAWHPNGQKHLEGMYVDGRQEGVWTWWHENGQKAITGEYHDSVAIGKWTWWSSEGKLAHQADLSPDQSLVGLTSDPQSEAREAKTQRLEPMTPLR